MSIRLKLNLKHVILGCQNFGDILVRNNTRLYSGFPQLATPRAIDVYKPTKPDSPNYTKDYVHTGRIFNPGGVLPWKSSIRSYYEKKCPQCPPPGPKVHKDCGEPPVPSCPPIAKPPICPVKRQCDPCKPKKRPCMKMTPCTLKTFPLYNCRFYSGSPCQPKVPSTKPKKPRFCKPTRTVVRPVPKCPSPAYTGRPNVNEVKGKTKVCQPKFGAPGGGVGGGDPCTGAPKAPKECYQTPGKTARPGQTGKKGPVCPPQSNPCGNPCGK